MIYSVCICSGGSVHILCIQGHGGEARKPWQEKNCRELLWKALLQAPCVASEKVIVIDDKFVASRVF